MHSGMNAQAKSSVPTEEAVPRSLPRWKGRTQREPPLRIGRTTESFSVDASTSQIADRSA
eukprot:6820922-Pyramimonas_sp.AAC.1